MPKVYLPQGMAKKFVFYVLGIVFLSSVLFNFSSVQAAYSASTLVSMTNSERARNGLGAFSTNSQLSSAATAKAQDILENQYFAHTSPQGKTPWDFIRGSGYDYTYAGENLAIGYTDASELFGAWMASATHRENILNPNFREIGIAVVSGTYEGAETIIVAQEFGAREATIEEEVASEQSTPAPKATNSPTSQASPTVSREQSFSINREKSNFYPKTIFAGEEVNFQATLAGDVAVLEFQVFDEKINLLETGTVSGEKEKTYSVKQKISNEGNSDVKIFAKDKNGNSDTLILGKLTVNKTVITKETTENKPTGIFAGFQASLQNYWYIYTIVAGIILSLAGYLILRYFKFGKALRMRLAMWEL